jgi:hypothetical protein
MIRESGYIDALSCKLVVSALNFIRNLRAGVGLGLVGWCKRRCDRWISLRGVNAGSICRKASNIAGDGVGRDEEPIMLSRERNRPALERIGRVGHFSLFK